MISFDSKKIVLPTNKGMVLAGTNKEELFSEPSNTFKEMMGEYGFVIFQGLDMNEADMVQFSGKLGRIALYGEDNKNVNYGNGTDPVFHINGDPTPDKVLCSTGSLPLHTDGLILGNKVDVVVLYAAQIGQINGGETTICDAKTAIRDMPRDLYEVIRAHECEFVALEKGYFSKVNGKYSKATKTINYIDGEEFWQIAMNFLPHEKTAWAGMVVGLEESESTNIMERLRAHFTDPKYFYRHRWTKGDLLLLDNRFCFHGREAFHGSPRILYNVNVEFQV